MYTISATSKNNVPIITVSSTSTPILAILNDLSSLNAAIGDFQSSLLSAKKQKMKHFPTAITSIQSNTK